MSSLSNLLFEWTTALVETNKNEIKTLLQREPELLWTPIPHTLDDFAPLRKKLVDIQRLGSSFQPVCAIQFICLLYHSFESTDSYQLLNYLVDQSSLHDLNTRYWGDCNNSTIHLVCFLENQPLVRLFIEKGISITCSNDLGYTPKDVITSSAFMDQVSKLQQQSLTKSKTRRPNYSTPDRFKLLKELAEESTITDNKQPLAEHRLKHEGKFFRKGLVNESKQKVLTEEDEQVLNEVEKSKRQMEVAQLVKKLAVKSNPLFQKYEKRAFYTAPLPKKLDASFFEQQPEPEPEIVHRPKKQHSVPERHTSLVNIEQQLKLDQPGGQQDQNDPDGQQLDQLTEEQQHPEGQQLDQPTKEQQLDQVVEEDQHINQSKEAVITTDERKNRLRSSIIMVPTTQDRTTDTKRSSKLRNSIIIIPQQETNRIRTSVIEQPKEAVLEEIIESSDESVAEEDDEENEDSTPVQIVSDVPIDPSEIHIPSNDSGIDILETNNMDEEPVADSRRKSGSQKASWTMSMSSWAAILDREFNLSEVDQDNKWRSHQEKVEAPLPSEKTLAPESTHEKTLDDLTTINNTVFSLASTLNFGHFETPVIPEPDALVSKTLVEPTTTTTTTKSDRRKAIYPQNHSTTASTLTLSTPIVQQHRRGYGKLYLHVNGIQNVQLPRPKNRVYVRCVVSDGRFEYMSRYELLQDNIPFNYECIIDTYPDMIITLSIHVRPDYLMKSRIPFARLFSRKKKESLSRFVNKEDGALGQARFAVTHMLPVCTESSYPAGFHCFNAWFKERRRLRKKQELKVVGNFDVEMLYLPAIPGQVMPRDLQEYKSLVNQYQQESDSYSTFY